MARISVRTESGQPWQFLESTPYSDEAVLRDLIFDEPALIPAADIGVASDMPAVAIREMGLPGAGSSDIILVYADGTIAIVECKLATNPERKREVIGQVIDYASSLSELTYDEFDERVKGRREESLLELMAKAAPSGEWDADRFLEQVTGTLTGGSFRLVIAIDVMDENLARLVRYISTQSRGALQVFGLELRYHASGDLEAIVPHIANPVGREHSTDGPTVERWNPERFAALVARMGPGPLKTALDDILKFAVQNSDQLNWGWAETYGAFGYPVSCPDGTTISVFSVYSTGQLTMNLKVLREKMPEAHAEEFVREVSSLPGFDRLRDANSPLPQFRIAATLGDDEIRATFKDAVLTLQRRVQQYLDDVPRLDVTSNSAPTPSS